MNRNRITGAARETAGRLRQVAGGAGQEIRQAAGTVGEEAALRAEGVYDEAVGLGQRLFGQARDHVRDLARFPAGDVARDLADEAYGTGRRVYGQGMKSLSRHAGAHPVALVLAAGVAGVAIGWLLTNRR